jgi:hypothetical protein
MLILRIFILLKALVYPLKLKKDVLEHETHPLMFMNFIIASILVIKLLLAYL